MLATVAVPIVMYGLRPRYHSPGTFRTRIWSPAVKTAGIDFKRPHPRPAPRHASWLLTSGADLKSAMDRTGHTQIQITQKYLHVLPDTDRRNLDAVRIVDPPSHQD